MTASHSNNKPSQRSFRPKITLPRFRFMAMSKLIGIISMMFVAVISVYAMYEIHVSEDKSSLNQLIISAFAFATIYAGFYITMAKAEHVEEEKTRREKELKALEHELGIESGEDEVQRRREELQALSEKINELISETNNYGC